MYRNNRSTRVPAISLDEYVLARTDTFYFLEFSEYSSEIFNENSVITSKPSAIFYTKDAQQHVILDYSLGKQEDKLYLETFFADMAPGVTFSFINGEYLEESKSLEANISSILEFVEYKGNMAFCKVSSVNDLNTSQNLYSGYYFINTPQVIKTQSLQNTDDTVMQALIFSNPKTAKPLLWLGYQPGDWIQILNPNSVNNSKMYEIADVLFINGKEVLKLKTDELINESLIGQNTIVNLFVKSKISTMINEYTNDQVNLGCCVNTSMNIALPQHTELQCALRGTGFVFNYGNCYGSLKTLINPITGETLLTPEQEAAITDPLQQAIQRIFDPTYLDEYYKKKITVLDTTGLVLTEENMLVTDFRQGIIPIIQSSLDNVSAINAEQEVSGVQVLTQVPKSLVQSFSQLEGVTLIADSPVYKILNICYEGYITNEELVIKGLGGTTLFSDIIYLNKNVLTTLFETNLSNDSTQRLVFSSTLETLNPVVDFKSYGYDYLQIGRYHIFTPIADEPKPLFIYTTGLKRANQYLGGISTTTVVAPANTTVSVDGYTVVSDTAYISSGIGGNRVAFGY